MQPTHATSGKTWRKIARQDRMKGAYAWKTLLDSGIALPLGSDFPVELANPFYGLRCSYATRQKQSAKGWYAHEALTIEQAFKFTLDAAYTGHWKIPCFGMQKMGRLYLGRPRYFYH